MSSSQNHQESLPWLGENDKRRASKLVGRLKSITEFLSDAVEKLGELSFTEAIRRSTPWAEPLFGATAEVLPPIKFLIKLCERITEINDPEELGRLACTISFERAAEHAVREVGGPVEEKRVIKEVKEQLATLPRSEDVDLSTFTYDNAIDHEYFRRAELELQTVLLLIGYNRPQIDRITNIVKDHFGSSIKLLLAQRETAEKFAPFKEFIELGVPEERQALKALAEHMKYQRWLFEEAPVLGKSPFALQHVYVETDCGTLTWKDINHSESRPTMRRFSAGQEEGLRRVNPFSEYSGGRTSLVKAVMDLMHDPELKEPIIIQGVAGSGKSSFTLRLCIALQWQQLRPIRIRFKDLRFDKHISEALAQAVKLSDEQRSPYGVPPTPEDIFQKGRIFRESGSGKYSSICRYVLILDGWDEIGVANEGFRSRIERMMEQLRREYIENPTLPQPVRVILTGRPSATVNDSGLLRDKTPILTIRPLTPRHLREFVQSISIAVKNRPLQSHEKETWPEFNPQRFEPIFKQYENEYQTHQSGYYGQQKTIQVGSLGALGLPLLAHLAARLISSWGTDPEHLVSPSTTLYRNLVNLTCDKGGKVDSDPDKVDDIRVQARIVGSELRELLWQTAAAMTVYGKDLIPYEELSKRLSLEDDELDAQVNRITRKHSLTSLLISFYFKGGIKHLGCEFAHKSFREYLFAEAVVETLKRYGETAPASLPERENYWKDFGEDDPRHLLTRELASLLAPQWLSPEIIFHLDNLIKWEIDRARGDGQLIETGLSTQSLTTEQWRRIRDGLADLWDWWGEGVHLRPQPQLGNRKELIYRPPYVLELIEHSLPYASLETSPGTPRTTTMDAHLGDSLFTLCVLVHYYFGLIQFAPSDDSKEPKRRMKPRRSLRRYQSLTKAKEVRFAPSGGQLESGSSSYRSSDSLNFSNYIHRINSAGWRPQGPFPASALLRMIDISNAFLPHVTMDGANLVGALVTAADLTGASLTGAILDNAILSNAVLRNIDLNKASLIRADLSSADLEGAKLDDANLEESSLKHARLSKARLEKANFNRADLTGAHLNRANLNKASFIGANLTGASIAGANLHNTNFSRAILAGANLTEANLDRTELNRADLDQATLDGAIMRHIDLTQVSGLAEDQLNNAVIRRKTKLPHNPVRD